MSDFQSGLEAFAKSAYQKYLEIVLKGKLGLEGKETTAEQEKEFQEDVRSIYTIEKIQDVATITDANSFQAKNNSSTLDENETEASTNTRGSLGDSEEKEGTGKSKGEDLVLTGKE